MKDTPTFDDLFRVMSAASVGDEAARVALPPDPADDDVPTRFAIALNLLLDELAFRASERRRAEEELRQAQKMEAVGRLAGGVAHDFNNLLSVILGYGHSMMSALDDGDPMRDDLAEVCRAGQRASELTRQLLTFSRQQVVEPTLVDLNEVLHEMRRTLERAAGPDVRVVARSARPLDAVRADPVGIEQVIINLVVNARDAMPAGGVITVETANVVLDEAYAHAHSGVTAGPHVMLAVCDEGVGMDAATRARVFEPFFTTKALGKGTGLGLSMVFGIVRQSGGSVRLESEPGRGSTFFLYFPRVEAPATPRPVLATGGVPGGSETILVVEDDDQVRRMTRGILKRAGYDVFEARNGAEAITISEQYAARIHLLVSDVMMPEISGPDLARRLARARPDMRVLCVSGYTDDIILKGEPGDVEISFLRKPLTPDALKRRVRDLLDGEAPVSR